MDATDEAYRFGRDIAGFARERAAQLRATHADPQALAAAIQLQCEAPATKALAAKLMAMKQGGLSVRAAEAWAVEAERGYREGMAESVPVH
ncbi:hypothetical protein MKK50_16230 [Methylobacterium sp. J-043]|nr:hypothetical protein [Methylobacterium sp. J-043]